MAQTVSEVPHLAVTAAEFRLYGCPICGQGDGSIKHIDGKTALITCLECGAISAVLNDALGITQATIGIGHCYPLVMVHPLRGTPARGSFSQTLFGEFFQPRRIRPDDHHLPSCFVCGDLERHYLMAALVASRESGERVVAMFPYGAKLDYRDWEPNHIQVKVGACQKHHFYLENLRELARAQGSIINLQIVQASMAL